MLAKLRRHKQEEEFRVQIHAGQSDDNLLELDFSRLDYMLVATHPRAAQIGPPFANAGVQGPTLLGGWPPGEGVGAARASGGGGGESAAAKAQAAPIEFSKNLDIDGFRQYAEQVADVTMKSTALHRLYDLFQLIHRAGAPVEDRQMDQKPENNCVLGFSQLGVKQPEFNNEIRKLVKTNKLWHGLSGSRELKKPTWVVYELLRQIGVRPQKHSRGPKEHDPDPKDFIYATCYIFCKDTLLKNRHRLQVRCCTHTLFADAVVVRVCACSQCRPLALKPNPNPTGGRHCQGPTRKDTKACASHTWPALRLRRRGRRARGFRIGGVIWSCRWPQGRGVCGRDRGIARGRAELGTPGENPRGAGVLASTERAEAAAAPGPGTPCPIAISTTAAATTTAAAARARARAPPGCFVAEKARVRGDGQGRLTGWRPVCFGAAATAFLH